MIVLIVSATLATISLVKTANDKSKQRQKYFQEAQSQLLQEKKDLMMGTEQQRSDALKSIAKQYAVNVAQASIEQKANEIADQKMKQDQIIAMTFGVSSVGLFIYTILKKQK